MKICTALNAMIIPVLSAIMAILAQELTPQQIISKIDETERAPSSKLIIKQTITTTSGAKRTLTAEAYSKGNYDKQLMIYTAPARVAGDKILMLNQGDDIWFYTPRTDRIRHLASHAKRQKVMGSDFSYEDLAGGKLEENYTYKLLRTEKVEGVACYKFELVPTPSGPHYSKLIYWADKERFVSIRIDYYDDDGKLLKRLILSDYDTVDGQLYPKKMVMTNLQEGGNTVIETEAAQFNLNLPDEIFTTRYLKRR